MWSCGVILYALVCGFLPFEDPDTAVLYKKIMKGKYMVPNFISKEVISLIGSMLTQDPVKRPSIATIREDKWFKISQPVCTNTGIVVGYT